MNVNYRLAEYGDIEFLSKTCRDSFPNSIKWDSALVDFSNRYWHEALSSYHKAIFIIEVGGRGAGLMSIIWDEIENKNTSNAIHPRIKPSWRILLVPYKVILKKIRYYANKQQIQFDEVASVCSVNERIFIDLMAVRPEFQRMGLGKYITEIAEELCIQHDKKAIHLNVDKDNVANISLLLSVGYSLAKSFRKQFRFEKRVLDNL